MYADLSNAKVGSELVPNFEKSLIQGASIVEQAVIDDLQNNVYHNEMEGVSSSTLKQCTTPIDYKEHLDNPKKYDKENMTVGTALHTLLLESDKFKYQTYDDEELVAKVLAEKPDVKSPRGTKRYQELISEYKGEDGEFMNDVLPLNIYKSMFRVRQRVVSDPIVKNLLINSVSEQSIMITYNNGLKVKIRPDMLKVADFIDTKNFKEYDVKVGDLINISVKTSIDASPEGFRREMYKLKYHLAEAFYQDVLKSVCPSSNIHTVYLVCEKSSENVFNGKIMLFHNRKETIARGREDYKNNLEVYEYCKRTGDYSMGYEFFNNGSILMEI